MTAVARYKINGNCRISSQITLRTLEYNPTIVFHTTIWGTNTNQENINFLHIFICPLFSEVGIVGTGQENRDGIEIGLAMHANNERKIKDAGWHVDQRVE